MINLPDQSQVIGGALLKKADFASKWIRKRCALRADVSTYGWNEKLYVRILSRILRSRVVHRVGYLASRSECGRLFDSHGSLDTR